MFDFYTKLKYKTIKVIISFFSILLAACLFIAACGPYNLIEDNDVELVVDNDIKNVYNYNSNLTLTPSVITIIDDINDFSIFTFEEKPASCIMTINADLNIINKDTSVICDFREAYNNYFKEGNIIPGFYISSFSVANALIDLYNSELFLFDSFIVSNDFNVVHFIRDALPTIRGVVDFSQKDIKADIKTISQEINKSKANTIILNQDTTSKDDIVYLKNRFKSVWLRCETIDEFEIASAVSKECYGIICDDFKFVFSVFDKYFKENIAELKSIAQLPINIAHRGVPDYYENSLQGFIKAYENGATHVELDVQLTKDNKLIVMHDDTINRTTDYLGNKKINQMTYDEISQYNIVQYNSGERGPNYEPIPLIEDVFNYFQLHDLIIVIEVKCKEDAAISILNKLIEQYNMADRIVIISSLKNQLINANNVCPEISTLFLKIIGEQSIATELEEICSLNSGIDFCFKANVDSTIYAKDMRDRGFIINYWTYKTVYSLNRGIMWGVTGVTNDVPNAFSDYAVKVEVDRLHVESVDDIKESVFNVWFVMYTGQKKEVDEYSILIIKTDNINCVEVILSCYFNSKKNNFKYIMYSEPIQVYIGTVL